MRPSIICQVCSACYPKGMNLLLLELGHEHYNTTLYKVMINNVLYKILSIIFSMDFIQWKLHQLKGLVDYVLMCLYNKETFYDPCNKKKCWRFSREMKRQGNVSMSAAPSSGRRGTNYHVKRKKRTEDKEKRPACFNNVSYFRSHIIRHSLEE